MEYPQRKHPRLKEYDYSQNGAYFITICTKNREKLLGRIAADPNNPKHTEQGMEQVQLSEIGQICRELLENIPSVYQGVCLDCYIIMPDHIHLLLQLDDSACTGGQGSGRPTVPGILHGFKRLASRRAGRALWQESFFEHVIRNEVDLAETRNYILENPMKWAMTKPESR